MLSLAHVTHADLTAVQGDLLATQEESLDGEAADDDADADPNTHSDPAAATNADHEGGLATLPLPTHVAGTEIDQLRESLLASLAQWPTDPRTSMDAVRLIWSAQWQVYLAWSATVAERAI